MESGLTDMTTTDTTNKTPIEIALEIDEEGMTTAKKLYNFLELNPAHYSRWCKHNIINNRFAEENEDYFHLPTTVSKRRGNFAEDYRLTASFAKRLSMKTSGERGEIARIYFESCEKGLKIATKKLNQQGNLQRLTDTLEKFTRTSIDINNKMDERLTKLENAIITHTVPKSKTSFSRWSNRMFPKYKLLMEFLGVSRKELYHNLYVELENTYPDIDLKIMQEDYLYENGLKECFLLDVIEHNSPVRIAFEAMVDSLLDKYNLQAEVETIFKARRTTIFDD